MSATSPIPPSLTSAYEAARDICARHARSFYFASHFLPQPKRDHAYAVYAFCRLLDDAADETGTHAAVDRFDRLLDRCYAERGLDDSDAAIQAFAHTVRVCGVPRMHFDELAEGCRMDLTVRRYDTWQELEQYCYRVAGVVGLVMCCVFDVRQPAAFDRAVAMGNAMQLTNILRDVREDLDRGRVYLPTEDRDRFGVTERHLQSRRWTSPFASMMRFEVDRARNLYRDGSRGIGYIADDGSRLTACVMGVVYGGILGAIEALDYDVFRRRAQVSTLGKLRRLPLARKLCRCEVGDEVPNVF